MTSRYVREMWFDTLIGFATGVFIGFIVTGYAVARGWIVFTYRG